MTLQIVKAQAWHIRRIAREMRPVDVVEVRIAAGLTPAAALIKSLRKSDVAFTGLIDGRPIGMFGVGPINVLGGVGGAWLLGTPEIETVGRGFARLSVEWRGKLWSRYPVLKNMIHDENKVTKRWLKWLGAEFSDPYLVNGHPFRVFEMRQPDV